MISGVRPVEVAEFLRTVYVPSRVRLSTRYVASLGESVEGWSRFLGRPARLGDFDEMALSSFLAFVARFRPATSVNSYRRRLLSLWEHAAATGAAGRGPQRRLVRTLPEEIDPPEAWGEGQVVELVNEAGLQTGSVGDVPACDWWLSLFLAVYWTSNRITATLAVESAHYDGAGILVRRQKNHRPQWFALPESCRRVVERTRPETRRLIWEHPWHPRTVWTKARAIIEAAGLPAPRTGRQLFHRLRRTTITLCASVDPDVAQRTAGHRDYQTTVRSYIDPRLLRARSAADVLPDPLGHKSATPTFHIYG
jgi:hypothetical protein